jgi:hypothetical protein
MAFTPSIDYVGHQNLRQKALGNVTKAKYVKKLKDEAEARRVAAEAAAARARSSRKVGLGRKIVGAVARGAAAYYTGGASEASGVGKMIDQQIQGGADKETNEYGDIVGAASTMSGMMSAKKVGAAAIRLNAQSARDDRMQDRMDKISPEAGLAFAEKIEVKNAKNRKVMDEYKDGFMNFGDVDGLDLSATTMDYSGLTKGKKVETTAKPVDNSPDANPITQLGTLPPSASISDSGGTSALLTQEQKDLLSGNETQVQQPVSATNTNYKAPVYTTGGRKMTTYLPPEDQIQQPESEIITEDSHNTQGVLGGAK